jgi:hypothetical protein
LRAHYLRRTTFLGSLAPPLSLKLFPCDKEHESPEEKHHQSPPEIHVDKEGPLVDGSIRQESKQCEQTTEDDEQQAQRKTKVNVHNSNCKMLTKDQIKNQGQYKHADPDWNRPHEPVATRFGRFFSQCINQPSQFFFATRFREKAYQDRHKEADGPSVNRSIKILRHLTWIDVNRCNPGAFDTGGEPVEMVSPWWTTAATVPDIKPKNAPCPVARFQNIPSKNVAKSGAFTNAKTNCNTSMMLLNAATK